MLELARERGSYDDLVVGDLCGFMDSRANTFDAIVSADTLVYFGAIDNALAAANNALRPGGVFIATFEALPGEGEEGYRIEIHGRYAHRESYLRQALVEAGFERIQLTRQTLRQERLQDVIGYVAVASKPLL
jgi:predicted TPR repeat methyltransferase